MGLELELEPTPETRPMPRPPTPRTKTQKHCKTENQHKDFVNVMCDYVIQNPQNVLRDNKKKLFFIKYKNIKIIKTLVIRNHRIRSS
jgi:hypothetical protein